MPQIPGMGPIPGGGGHGGGKRQATKGKKKSASRSGNPAKRAAENAALASGATPGGNAPAGSGFGLGAAPKGAPSEEELAALQKMLGR
jgi:signal recognition particle subunit SRP54